MQKKLLALCIACLGASGAFAQVQIYGRLDLGVITATNDGKGTSLDQVSPNRWGFIGKEDLGSGWTAFFRLENRFLLDTGMERSGQSGMQWTDKAWVGIGSKDFGSISMGRILPVGNTILGGGDFEAMTDSIGSVNSRKGRVESNLNNGIKYDTPVFDMGVVGRINIDSHYVFNEGTDGGKSPYGVGFQYRVSSLKMDVGYQHDVFKDGSLPQAEDRLVNSVFGGAAWDFGFMQLKGTYAKSHGYDADKVKNEMYRMQSWQVSMNTDQLGPGILGVMYNYKTERDGKGKYLMPVKKFALGYWYKLSKRTMLMPTYAVETVNWQGRKTSKQYVQIGMRHEF